MLKGIKVLDLSRYISGPLCTAMLADQGAEVIKIQNTAGDGARIWGPPFHKDGSSVAFDVLSTSQQALRDLASKCDILVQNFKPGTLDRFDCGYHSLRLLNKRLIFCSITGYGSKGPLSKLGGFDTTLQAYSGLLNTTGTVEQPVKVGFSVTDILSSYIAVGCIGQALYHRQMTGQGVKIETSLLEAALYTLGINAQAALDANYEFMRTGNKNYLLSPQGIYHSKDGVAFFIACGSETLYKKTAAIIGFQLREEFDSNSKRRQSWDTFDPLFRGKIAEHTMEYIETEFMKASIPFSRINTIAQTVKEPQVKAMSQIVKEKGNPEGRNYVRFPASISGIQDTSPIRSPQLGAHTASVLKEICGYNEGQITEILKSG